MGGRVECVRGGAYGGAMPVERQVGGAWIPAIPLRAPLGVRLRCEHRWVAHAVVAEDGTLLGLSPVDYDCTRCGGAREAGAWPRDGRDEGVLARVGRRIFR